MCHAGADASFGWSETSDTKARLSIDIEGGVFGGTDNSIGHCKNVVIGPFASLFRTGNWCFGHYRVSGGIVAGRICVGVI